MASAIAKFFSHILSLRQHRKIAIIGLDDAGGIDLLKRLCGTRIEEKSGGRGLLVHTGTKSTLKCDFHFVVVEVGGSAPPWYHLWMAAQFHDADGFIWVVDSADADRFVESRVEMGYARMGRRLNQGTYQGGDQPAVGPEKPWLVLVDFKQNPLSVAEATSQAERVITDAGDNLDWTFGTVSITTSEGLSEAMEWIYKKVK